MIIPSEEDYIRNYAYVPEHIVGYVVAISQAEPYLFGDFLCYNKEGTLIFIGYPLPQKEHHKEKEIIEALNVMIERFKPGQIALVSPAVLISQDVSYRKESDHYYVLRLSSLCSRQKVRNMVNRASRELHIEQGQKLGGDHIQLISEFLASRNVDNAIRYIYERIPEYVFSVSTARVFSARDKAGELVAFDIAEFGAKDYVFYMFNFVSRHNRVPGASDYLLDEIIKTAQQEEKSFINLGLGINNGVAFFKKKWGGIPFFNYEFYLYQPARRGILKSLVQRLLKQGQGI